MRCHLGRQRRAGQLGNCSLQGTGFEWWAGRSGCVEWNIVTECCSFVSDRGRHCMMAGFTSVLTVHVMLHMASSWLGCPIALPNFSPKFVNSSNPPLSLTGRTRTDGRTDADGGHKFRSFLARPSRPRYRCRRAVTLISNNISSVGPRRPTQSGFRAGRCRRHHADDDAPHFLLFTNSTERDRERSQRWLCWKWNKGRINDSKVESG